MAAEKRACRNRKWSKSGRLSLLSVSTWRRTWVERSPTLVQQLGTHYLTVLWTLRYLLFLFLLALQRAWGTSQKLSTKISLLLCYVHWRRETLVDGVIAILEWISTHHQQHDRDHSQFYAVIQFVVLTLSRDSVRTTNWHCCEKCECITAVILLRMCLYKKSKNGSQKIIVAAFAYCSSLIWMPSSPTYVSKKDRAT